MSIAGFSWRSVPGGAALLALVCLVQPVCAKDKDSVELTCGGTKATITCTKFEDNEMGDGTCVASTLSFDTPKGKHIVAKDLHDIPQFFQLPTIADSLNCLQHDKKTLILVSYTPNCRYDQCEFENLFSLNGIQLTKNGQPFTKTIGGEYTTTPIPAISLRGSSP